MCLNKTRQPKIDSTINENHCPTIGYIRDHDIKYLLRRQPANTLCHGPADPRRWADKNYQSMKIIIIITSALIATIIAAIIVNRNGSIDEIQRNNYSNIISASIKTYNNEDLINGVYYCKTDKINFCFNLEHNCCSGRGLDLVFLKYNSTVYRSSENFCGYEGLMGSANESLKSNNFDLHPFIEKYNFVQVK